MFVRIILFIIITLSLSGCASISSNTAQSLSLSEAIKSRDDSLLQLQKVKEELEKTEDALRLAKRSELQRSELTHQDPQSSESHTSYISNIPITLVDLQSEYKTTYENQYNETSCKKALILINKGSVEASIKNKLGWCYANGIGVPENYAEAKKWYGKAGYSNIIEPQESNVYSGSTTASSTNGVENENACNLALLEINKGSVDSNVQNKLGWCYANGVGVAENYAEATKWYKKAGYSNVVISQESNSTESYTTYTEPYTIYTGPRGGRFHYSASGKKVYQKRK
ncbi:MAG: tetratricopeptide repeat protein [Methylococcales bacterium]|nr:tetratricopeptide repeat protein [Methylococcales bacterium]